MNKLSALALGTALTLSMPLAALAQDVGVELDAGVTTELGGEDAGADAGVDAGVSADDGVSVDAGAEAGADATATSGADVGAGATGDYTYGDLDAALQAAANLDLSTVTADTEIEIVDIADLTDEGEFTAEAFTSARADFEADIDSVRSEVEGNAELEAALEAEGFTADDVVAVSAEPDGTVTIFVDAEAAGDDAGVDAGAAAGGGVSTDSTSVEGGADASAGAEATTE